MLIHALSVVFDRQYHSAPSVNIWCKFSAYKETIIAGKCVQLSLRGAWVKDIRGCVHCKMKQCPSVLDAHDINFLLSTPQIHRSKNKWKFHLKDGIMNLNGRDYVFSKAIGDAEWWSRKKKKQTKRQEQELCNSFYPVNRHFNILPYPVTGFISGNFYRVFENSDKPKGLWGTVKTWVSSKKTLD